MSTRNQLATLDDCPHRRRIRLVGEMYIAGVGKHNEIAESSQAHHGEGSEQKAETAEEGMDGQAPDPPAEDEQAEDEEENILRFSPFKKVI